MKYYREQMGKTDFYKKVIIPFIAFVICSDGVFIYYILVRNPVKNIIYKGNLIRLERILSPDKLQKLTPIELRILRNTIYAKHGYDFGSTDLDTHFKQFEWYKPKGKKVDSELTPVDSINIRLIRYYEENYNKYHFKKQTEKVSKYDTIENETTVNEKEDVGLTETLPETKKIKETSKNPEVDFENLKENERILLGYWKANENMAVKFNEKKEFIVGAISTDNAVFGKWAIANNILYYVIHGEFKTLYTPDERKIKAGVITYIDSNKITIRIIDKDTNIILERTDEKNLYK